MWRATRGFVAWSCLFAVGWTIIGVLVAAITGDSAAFCREWVLLQGPFLIALGAWLFFTAQRSPADALIEPLNPTRECVWRSARRRTTFQAMVVSAIGVVGTASLTSLRFRAPSLPTLVFMVLTAGVICVLAGFATWHGVELLVLTQRMRSMPLDLFAYSPAETRGLRKLADHVVTYSGVLTIGYAFALAATLLGRWGAPATWVRTVRVFWPVLYVPFCLTLLVIPQFQLRALVRERKDALLGRWEASMNALLRHPDQLDKEQVAECNSLADLFERVSGTPEFVIDLSLAAKSLSILAVNVFTLAIPRDLLASWVRLLIPL